MRKMLSVVCLLAVFSVLYGAPTSAQSFCEDPVCFGGSSDGLPCVGAQDCLPGGVCLSCTPHRPSQQMGQKQLYVARWAAKEFAPVVDGVMSPSEWSDAIPVHVTFVQPDLSPGVLIRNPEGSEDANPNDLSFTIRAIYTHDGQEASNALYIAVSVRDADLVADDQNAGHDDSVEVYIDGDRKNGCPVDTPDSWWWWLREFGIVDIYELFTPCADGVGAHDMLNFGLGDVALILMGPEGFQVRTTWEGVMEYVGSNLGLEWDSAAQANCWDTGPCNGYVVEFEIPLTSIDTADGEGVTVPPVPGDYIGFNIAVNDDDDGGVRETVGAWDSTGHDWFWAHEDEWGTLYLMPDVGS